MSYMNYSSAKQIAHHIQCKSEWEAFDRDGNVVLEREVRACFALLRRYEDINRIKIYMYAYAPELSVDDNAFHLDKDRCAYRYYPVTDLSVSMMRKILGLVNNIVDFKHTISTEHIEDENGNDRLQYCINLLFPTGTNIIQRMFVCTIARWFYEQQNRYIALKAYELYNTEKYHRFGFLNLYCLVKEQCSDNVNSSGHDLLDGTTLCRRVFYHPGEFKSIYEMSSLLREGRNITSFWKSTNRLDEYVPNTSVSVTKMYCHDDKQESDFQERLESNIDFIISKIKGNETFDCENEEQ